MSEETDPLDARTPEEIEADNAPDNAANYVAVKRKRRKNKDDENLEATALAGILATKGGRLVMRTILYGICNVDGPVSNAAFDVQGLFFREGARAAGMLIRDKLIKANQHAYLTMLQEELESHNA